MQLSAKLRILYLEDDEGLARLLQRKMRREGFEVDMAPDGLKGLAMLDRESYDVLLVDHKMPGLSGFQVLQKIES